MPLLAVNLTQTTTEAKSFVANINWAQPSWDLFIILFFIVAALLYGLSLGRDRVITILISVYMALAVVNFAPYIGSFTADVGVSQFFVVRVSTFVVVFVALFFLMSRSALLATVAKSDSTGAWWQVLLFSFLHVGLLVSITLSFLPDTATANLAPITQRLFAQDNARFFWIVAPIISMILIRGGNSDKKYKYEI